MHQFTPVEPGVDQCAAPHPYTGIECGRPAANGTHIAVTVPTATDEATRRLRAVDSLNRVEAAFHAIAKDDTTPMARVFCAIAAAGPRGITDNELYVHPDLAGMPQSTIRPRRVDLETAGLIVRATDATNDNVKRPTESGGYAQVWVIGSLARRLLLRHDTTRSVA